MARILAIPEGEVSAILQETIVRFGARHRRFEELLEHHFSLGAHRGGDAALSRARRLLIGAYSPTNEYSGRRARRSSNSILGARRLIKQAPKPGRAGGS